MGGRPVEFRLRVVLDMRTQLCDRAKTHGPVWKLRFDRAVGIERIGHAVDHARLEDRNRARLPLGTRRRLAVQGWLPGVELLLLLRRTRWRLWPKQKIQPGLFARLLPRLRLALGAVV